MHQSSRSQESKLRLPLGRRERVMNRSRRSGASGLLPVFFFLTWVSGCSVHLWRPTEVIIFLFSLLFYIYSSIKKNCNCRAVRNDPRLRSLPLLDAFSIYFLPLFPWCFSVPDSVLLTMVSRVTDVPRYCRAQMSTFLPSVLPVFFPKALSCSSLGTGSVNLCNFFGD